MQQEKLDAATGKGSSKDKTTDAKAVQLLLTVGLGSYKGRWCLNFSWGPHTNQVPAQAEKGG